MKKYSAIQLLSICASLFLTFSGCKEEESNLDKYLAKVAQSPYKDLVYFSTLYTYRAYGCYCFMVDQDRTGKDSTSNCYLMDMELRTMDTTATEVIIVVGIPKFLHFIARDDISLELRSRCTNVPYEFTYNKSSKKLKHIRMTCGSSDEFAYNIRFLKRYLNEVKDKTKSAILDFVINYHLETRNFDKYFDPKVIEDLPMDEVNAEVELWWQNHESH
jgi:hypothetical protein